MQQRKFDLRWTLVMPWIIFVALVAVYFLRTHAAHSPATAGTQPPDGAAENAVLDTRHDPRPAPTATLAESILAADILVKAGKMAPPPTLGETWTAIDQLIKAGELPTPPWALDVEPTPTLRQILEAADILVNAGKMAPPPGGADHHALSEPPEAPPPPVATSTIPVRPAVAQPTATAVAPTSTPVVPSPTAVPPKKTAGSAGSGGWFDDAYTAAVFASVNQQRVSAGLPSLSIEPRLATAAASYAKVLTDNNWFSHTGPDGSTLVTRDEAAGFPFTVQIGEVLAWGSNGWTAPEVVEAWMDSPAHHEQIMSGVYVRAGAGCYFTRDNGTVMVRCAMELAGS